MGLGARAAPWFFCAGRAVCRGVPGGWLFAASRAVGQGTPSKALSFKTYGFAKTNYERYHLAVLPAGSHAERCTVPLSLGSTRVGGGQQTRDGVDFSYRLCIMVYAESGMLGLNLLVASVCARALHAPAATCSTQPRVWLARRTAAMCPTPASTMRAMYVLWLLAYAQVGTGSLCSYIDMLGVGTTVVATCSRSRGQGGGGVLGPSAVDVSCSLSGAS